jgi:N-acylglucosamine 2-epimerase
MTSEECAAEARFYFHHLTRKVLPFWLERGVDQEHGGFYTCFDNTGGSRVSTDKYSWSQGRAVWLFSRLSAMERFDAQMRERFLQIARRGAEFLVDHAFLENGHVSFVLSRTGEPIDPAGNGRLDFSTFADCFVVLGLAAFAVATPVEPEARRFSEVARSLYDSVLERKAQGTFVTQPEPMPEGYDPHAIPMIILGLSEDLEDALRRVSSSRADGVAAHARDMMNTILSRFVDADGVLHEAVPLSGGFDTESIVGRLHNPGHTIEDLWFMAHRLLRSDQCERVADLLPIAARAMELGWDTEYGGMLHFVDSSGGPPSAPAGALENHPMVAKIRDTWANKLWWPHTEALYTLLLLGVLTKDDRMLSWYRRVKEYTFATFPNPDESVGEWIQIRDRTGAPVNQVVALPVKDPFHIIRSLYLLVAMADEPRLFEGGPR